jgi:hypothetical protein
LFLVGMKSSVEGIPTDKGRLWFAPAMIYPLLGGPVVPYYDHAWAHLVPK